MDTAKYTAHAENFIKLLLTISGDTPRDAYSLGQRLMEMRHISDFPSEKQVRLAGETACFTFRLLIASGFIVSKQNWKTGLWQFSDPDNYLQIQQKYRKHRKTVTA